MDNYPSEEKCIHRTNQIVSSENNEYVPKTMSTHPGERLRLFRRMSEPGLPNTVSYGTVTTDSPPMYKPFRGRKFSRRSSCESVPNERAQQKLLVAGKAESSNSVDKQKRMSVPTISISTNTEEPVVTGTFLVTQIGTEKFPSGGRPHVKVNVSRRTSLPTIPTREENTDNIHGISQSLTEPQKTMKRMPKRTSLPNIFGVHPQKSNGVSMTGEYNYLPAKMPVNNLSEAHKLLPQPQQASASGSKYGYSETNSKGECNPFSTEACVRPKLVRRASEPWAGIDHAAKHDDTLGIESPRRLRQVRRTSDTVAHDKSKYLPVLPMVRDASFEGADIENWLENVRPTEYERWDALETDAETETNEDIDALYDEHRSISQLKGNFNDKWHGECELWNEQGECFEALHEEESGHDKAFSEGFKDVTLSDFLGEVYCKNKDSSEGIEDLSNFHKERFCMNKNLNEGVEEVSGLFRNLSTVEQVSQETHIVRHNTFRRNTLAATENILSHSSTEYKPKTCWCLRCLIMNAMYFNGDETLGNWGNYPCFRR